MKAAKLLILGILAFGAAKSQCKNIIYRIGSKKCFEMNDKLNFRGINRCKISKFVLYSLEYYDSTNSWQEIDNDIFTMTPKEMKIIKLDPNKNQEFNFSLIDIDNSLFNQKRKVRFRIIENLYSANKVEIIRTRTIKEFVIGCTK